MGIQDATSHMMPTVPLCAARTASLQIAIPNIGVSIRSQATKEKGGRFASELVDPANQHPCKSAS